MKTKLFKSYFIHFQQPVINFKMRQKTLLGKFEDNG